MVVGVALLIVGVIVDCGCCCLLSWEPTDKWFHICFFKHKHNHMVCAWPQGI